MTTAPISDDEATELVTRLMAIPGRSGEEAAILAAITDELLAAGVDADQISDDGANERSEFGGDSGNLIVHLPGEASQPRRMLSAHCDTVPICVGCQPVRDGDRVVSGPTTGLGADDRAGCAILLATAIALGRGDTPHPPLTLLFTVQEEVGLHGAQHVAVERLGAPQLAFNFDGGSPSKVVVGATGGYRMTITITGLASHAGNSPEKGISAIAIASLAIADLVDSGWHGLIEKDGRRGVSNIGVIQGGVATNVVADRVVLRAEARSHDPEFRRRIVEEMRAAFDRAAQAVTSDAGQHGEIDWQGGLDYESFRLPDDEPSVVAAADAIRSLGGEPVLGVTNGGIDANWLNAHGLPAVTLGCGQQNIHTVDEQLDLEEFHFARRLALALALGG